MNKKILSVILLLFLIAPAFSWWSDNWMFSQGINLTQLSGDIKDYHTLSLTVEKNDYMNDDFSDLRIVYNDSYAVDAHIQSYNSTHAVVYWMDNQTITNTTTEYFLYYGNPHAPDSDTLAYAVDTDFEGITELPGLMEHGGNSYGEFSFVNGQAQTYSNNNAVEYFVYFNKTLGKGTALGDFVINATINGETESQAMTYLSDFGIITNNLEYFPISSGHGVINVHTSTGTNSSLWIQYDDKAVGYLQWNGSAWVAPGASTQLDIDETRFNVSLYSNTTHWWLTATNGEVTHTTTPVLWSQVDYIGDASTTRSFFSNWMRSGSGSVDKYLRFDDLTIFLDKTGETITLEDNFTTNTYAASKQEYTGSWRYLNTSYEGYKVVNSAGTELDVNGTTVDLGSVLSNPSIHILFDQAPTQFWAPVGGESYGTPDSNTGYYYQVNVTAIDEDTDAVLGGSITIAGDFGESGVSPIDIDTLDEIGTYNVSISSSGYTARDFIIRTQETWNKTIRLLSTSKGETVTFTIADPDDITDVLENEEVIFYFNDYGTPDYELYTESYTDSNGQIAVFVNTTHDYCIIADGATMCNDQTVTLLQPLDEKNPSIEIANYTVLITGAVSYSYYDQNGDITFNTFTFADDTTITVENSTYFARSYVIKNALVGQSFTIQPYLLSITDGAYNTFIVKDPDGTSVANAYMYIQREISGVFSEILSGSTDDSGSLIAFLDPTSAYRIITDATDQGYNLYSTTLVPAGTTYYIILGASGEEYTLEEARKVLQIFPATDAHEGDIITGYAYDPAGGLVNVTMRFTWNGTEVYNVTSYTVGYSTSIDTNTSDLNISDWDYFNPLFVSLCANYTDNTTRCVYTTYNNYNYTGLVRAVDRLVQEFEDAPSGEERGVYVLTIIAIAISVMPAMVHPILFVPIALFFVILGVLPLWIAIFGTIIVLGLTLAFKGKTRGE